MFNVASNSGIAPQTPASASSPLSTLINNTTAANGQPVFAQVVRDALNRTTSDAETQQVPPSKKTDSKPAAPTSASPGLLNATAPKITDGSKQQSTPQSQLVANDLAILPALWMPGLQVPSTALIPGEQTSSALPAGSDSENSAIAPTATGGSDRQASQSAGGNESIQFASQLQLLISSATLISSEASAGEDASPVAASKPTESNGTPNDVPPTASATPAAESAATAVAVAQDATAAATLASSDPALAVPAAARTSGAGVAGQVTSPKGEVVSQVSISSPSPQQGQRLSSVLEQLAELQGPAPIQSSASSVTTDLARTAAQSQLTEAAENTGFAASTLQHTLLTSPVIPSTDGKGTQSNPVGSRPTSGAQNAVATPNDHSAAPDSSSNQGGQNSSGASTSTDSSATPPPSPKNESPDSSDELAAVSTAKPDTSPAAQVANPAAPVIAASSQPTEPTVHSVQNALPSAPAQAQPQPALPTLHAPDTAWGHLVSDAQLTNTAGQSEMRIAIQTDKLGTIELHARVSGDEVGAAIFVEKRDAHAALAIELPALQQALSDKQLRVDQVALTQGLLSSTTGDAGANAQSGQRGMGQPPRSNSFWNESRAINAAAWFVPEQTGVFTAQGRLSVQA